MWEIILVNGGRTFPVLGRYDFAREPHKFAISVSSYFLAQVPCCLCTPDIPSDAVALTCPDFWRSIDSDTSLLTTTHIVHHPRPFPSFALLNPPLHYPPSLLRPLIHFLGHHLPAPLQPPPRLLSPPPNLQMRLPHHGHPLLIRPYQIPHIPHRHRNQRPPSRNTNTQRHGRS